MAYNPVVRFQKSPSLDVDHYVVTWTLNGAPPFASALVPKSTTSDIVGYTVPMFAGVPTLTLVGGDIVGVNVKAANLGGLVSSGVSGSITIPATAPENPTNVVLTLS